MRDSDLADSAVPAPLAVLGDTVLQSEVLGSLAFAVNYNNWLTHLATPYLGDWPIELGSGLGDYAQTWLNSGTPRITTTEIDPSRLSDLKTRFTDEPRVEVAELDILNPPPGEHSSLVAFNVLEHICEDVEALRAAHTVVRPGGHVVIFVPAFSFAMSRFDRAIGHVRRYTTGGLTSAFTTAGLEPLDVRYVNMPGLPAWVVMMRMMRQEPHAGAMRSWWDQRVIPAARKWESKHKPPFGQSVFGIARVPTKK